MSLNSAIDLGRLAGSPAISAPTETDPPPIKVPSPPTDKARRAMLTVRPDPRRNRAVNRVFG